MWTKYKPSITDIIGIYENLFYDKEADSNLYEKYC
jgi:hypothetical protein